MEDKELLDLKTQKNKIEDISNIRGSPFEDTNCSIAIKAPHRDSSVLKSFDYSENFEELGHQIPIELRKEVHPYSNMHNNRFLSQKVNSNKRKSSRNEIRSTKLISPLKKNKPFSLKLQRCLKKHK